MLRPCDSDSAKIRERFMERAIPECESTTLRTVFSTSSHCLRDIVEAGVGYLNVFMMPVTKDSQTLFLLFCVSWKLEWSECRVLPFCGAAVFLIP